MIPFAGNKMKNEDRARQLLR